MENLYVKDVYDEIAKSWDRSHGYHWKRIKDFMLSVEKGLILDMGCGNGKNMLLRDDCQKIGFDFSKNNVKVCKEKNLEVMVSDAHKIPFRDNIFDSAISVAVLHHLIEGRKEAVKEMVRILKPGGLLFLQVWAETVKKSKKFICIENNDYFVTWYVNKDKKLKRFYHLFGLEELKILFEGLNVEIIETGEEMDNYYIIVKKN